MKLKELTGILNKEIPLRFQESYDNSGLQVGNPEKEIHSALITLDVTEDVLNEAIGIGADVIISHHPLIFGGIKKLTESTVAERIIASAIRNEIAIYSSHTNLDVFRNGVSRKMAEKIGLSGVKPLSPLSGHLMKLVTFVPLSHIDKVQEAVFNSGAGVIGNYDWCGYTVSGLGSFRGGDTTSPFVGEKGKIHSEEEVRFETIIYAHLQKDVVKALLSAHPYEEVAYDIYQLHNETTLEGLGCIGELKEPLSEHSFLDLITSTFGSGRIRFSNPVGNLVARIAVCGGSGSSLLDRAIASGADALVTADVKYHAFRDAENKILLVDAGHYETEKFAVEILFDLIVKNFPKFALRFSDTSNNPVNYL